MVVGVVAAGVVVGVLLEGVVALFSVVAFEFSWMLVPVPAGDCVDVSHFCSPLLLLLYCSTALAT